MGDFWNKILNPKREIKFKSYPNGVTVISTKDFKWIQEVLSKVDIKMPSPASVRGLNKKIDEDKPWEKK